MALDERMKDDTGGDGDVEGVLRSVHGDLDGPVTECQDVVGESGEFIAEHHGHRSGMEIDVRRSHGAVRELGGVHADARCLELGDRPGDVGFHGEGDNEVGTECRFGDLATWGSGCVAGEDQAAEVHRISSAEDRPHIVQAAHIVEDGHHGMAGNGGRLGRGEPEGDEFVERAFLHTANIVLCRTMIRRRFLTTLAAFALVRPSRGLAALAPAGAWEMYVLGDWGAGGSLQRQVADAMRARARKAGPPKIVLSTGDNIYPSGVASVDDPQWTTKYEKVYAGLDVPWWAILGNHDHRGNVDAQVAYGTRNPRWNMPGRTWAKDFSIDAVTNLRLIALDTTPLLQKKDGWKEQLEFLERSLADAPAGSRRIVAGHHPLRSYGHYGDSDFLVRNVKPILDRHAVSLYCSGHDHDLQAIRHPQDAFGCLVSGGGGGTRPSKRGPHTKAMIDTGGFASVSVTSTTMTVRLFDRSGADAGEMTL